MYALAEIRTRAGLLWRSDLRATAAARLVVASALAMLAVGAALAATARSEPPGAELVAASGALHQHNTRAGAHILRSHNQMRPGDQVDGRVKIKNTGDVAGLFTLVKQALSDPASRSSRLTLRVDDVTGNAAVPVYDGDLASMPATTPLPTAFAPGEQREYEFTLLFDPQSPPAGGYASATTSVDFKWGADLLAPPSPPVPPAPPAAPQAPPTPAPASAPASPAPVAAPAPAPAPRTPAPKRVAPKPKPKPKPSKARACAAKVGAKKLRATAKKRALAACKKKPAKRK